LSRRAVDILHCRQAGSRVRGNVGGMHCADAAAAEHSDSGHQSPSLVVFAILVAFN
jgi:hypothetical protein